MNSTRLIENINSDYFEAFNKLLPKNSKKRIIVFVESEEDISFWRNVLNEFEKQNIDFQIQIPNKNGKSKAIEKSNELINMSVGEYLIVCVDSDYDYLLQNTQKQSQLINQNKFIFQTYSYSIENLLCFSESLHLICVQATKFDQKIIDFDLFLKSFSSIIYDLFVWSVYFRKIENTTEFNITDFKKIIQINQNIDFDENCKNILEDLKIIITTKIKYFRNEFKDDIIKVENFKIELEKLGLKTDNSYLFIQGHTLMDNIILMILKPLCLKKKNLQIQAIKDKYSGNNKEINDNINYYNNNIQKVELVIKNNTEFKNCFLFLKLKSDIESYIIELKNN